MITKTKEKEAAVILRKRGFSYSEILGQIPVAKSTLSLWLRSVGLAEKQKQRLTEKRLAAALRGSNKKRERRIAITKEIKTKARNEIKNLSNRELWLIGIALYWAEGTKQKEHNISQKVKFSNSDPKMIKIFLNWLRKICNISNQDINFRISIHETERKRLGEIKKYWSRVTKFPLNMFQEIDWKRHKINTKRKNIGEKYFGLVNIYVKKSTNFNRKIEGWIEGICKNCGVV